MRLSLFINHYNQTYFLSADPASKPIENIQTSRLYHEAALPQSYVACIV